MGRARTASIDVLKAPRMDKLIKERQCFWVKQKSSRRGKGEWGQLKFGGLKQKQNLNNTGEAPEPTRSNLVATCRNIEITRKIDRNEYKMMMIMKSSANRRNLTLSPWQPLDVCRKGCLGSYCSRLPQSRFGKLVESFFAGEDWPMQSRQVSQWHSDGVQQNKKAHE